MAKLKSPMISNVRHSMKVYKLYWTHGIGASHKDLYRKAMQREHFQCCIRHVQQRRTHSHSCRAFSVVLLNDSYLFSSYKFTVWIESHFYLCFFFTSLLLFLFGRLLLLLWSLLRFSPIFSNVFSPLSVASVQMRCRMLRFIHSAVHSDL